MVISVFLVDDHPIMRDGLSALLKSQTDLRIIGSEADGYNAVLQVQALHPDIVLMDISMPTLNGIEATVKIIENCPNTRVIILSMHDDSEHIYRALKAGAKGYLLKESAGQEVIQAIHKVHAGGNYFSQKVADKVTDNFVNHRSEGTVFKSLDLLSTRELETLQMVVDGKSSFEISKALCLSQKTIETYRSRIMDKLDIHDIPGLVKYAIQQGLTSLE